MTKDLCPYKELFQTEKNKFKVHIRDKWHG